MEEYELHTQGASHRPRDDYDGRDPNRNRAPAEPDGLAAGGKFHAYSPELMQRLLADERRKALEKAEARLRQRLDAAKRTHEVSAGLYSEGMRDAYDVAILDIRALIPTKEDAC